MTEPAYAAVIGRATPAGADGIAVRVDVNGTVHSRPFRDGEPGWRYNRLNPEIGMEALVAIAADPGLLRRFPQDGEGWALFHRLVPVGELRAERDQLAARVAAIDARIARMCA